MKTESLLGNKIEVAKIWIPQR